MFNNKKVTAIVLAAGNSTRFGLTTNKNFVNMLNKPIVLYSIEAFLNNSYIDDIIIVIKESETKIINQILSSTKLSKPTKLVIGGKIRKESVYNALISTSSEIVIIHDSARPLIKNDYINNCLNSMLNFKCASIAVKSKDTIKITDDNGIVLETTNRKNTWIIQTPQCFDRAILLNSHKQFENDEKITDDCMLLELCNYKVQLINGDYSNIKLTTCDDLKLLENYMQ